MVEFLTRFGNGAASAFTDLELANERRKLLEQKPDAQLPEFFSGARCKLLINGSTIGAALEVSWAVRADIQEIRTIDNYMPVELVPAQVSVSATLKRIVDPRRTLGGDGLFSTITSHLHQPYASIEVRDRLGNVVFLARGIFKDVQGSVGNGRLGVESVNFVGYYWRENVDQEFSPVKESVFSNLAKRFTKNSIVSKTAGAFF